MARDHRTSKADFPLDDARRLRQQGQSYYKIAVAIGWSMPQTRRYLRGEVAGNHSAVQSSADDTAALARVPDTYPTTVQTSALSSAETLADHEPRLQVLESFLKALQEHAQQPPVQHITVHPSADSAYALPSAESVQTWDNPEDAKPERWNLWLPRGLKRRIEAQARAAGIAPSSLVQRLLMAAVNGQEGRGDA